VNVAKAHQDYATPVFCLAVKFLERGMLYLENKTLQAEPMETNLDADGKAFFYI
jgi:hypothetical protein